MRIVPDPDPRGAPGTPLASRWAPGAEDSPVDALSEWEWWSLAALRALARGDLELETAAAERATIARAAYLVDSDT